MRSPASTPTPTSVEVTPASSVPGFRSGSSNRQGDCVLPNKCCLRRILPCVRKTLLMPGITLARTRLRSTCKSVRTSPLSRGRFYSNENFPLTLVMELRLPVHDVFTSLEAGRANSAVPDPDVLAFAANQERILLTCNRRDFLRLHHSRTKRHAGIVLCTFDADFAGQARRIHAALAVLPQSEDQLVRVNRPA